MDLDRLKHSYAVAIKMVEIGKSLNLSEEELKELFLLGYVHDIGYQFDKDRKHNVVGAEILNNGCYKYSNEVLYHGDDQSEYSSLFLDILNAADMQIDKYGNDVGFSKRLEDIKSRYSEDSIVYKKCLNIVNRLKDRF